MTKKEAIKHLKAIHERSLGAENIEEAIALRKAMRYLRQDALKKIANITGIVVAIITAYLIGAFI